MPSSVKFRATYLKISGDITLVLGEMTFARIDRLPAKAITSTPSRPQVTMTTEKISYHGLVYLVFKAKSISQNVLELV